MSENGRVLLITGPAGSGKSTLAEHISAELNWRYVSEDEYWVREGWGAGHRSEDQERVIQEKVLSDLKAVCQLGRSAVLEFILYKDPPNPLTAYTNALSQNSIQYDVVALKPTLEEILRRIQKRGRPEDLHRLNNDVDDKRRNAENQLRCLESHYMDREWIIDSTDKSVAALADCIQDKLELTS